MRLKRVRELMASQGLEALATFNPYNIFYLTDFTAMEGTAVVLHIDEEPTLIVPRLEYERALSEAKGCRVVAYSRYGEQREWLIRGGLVDAVISVLKGLEVRAVGLEYSTTPYATVERIKAELGAETIKDSSDVISRARMVKDEDEVRAMRKSMRVAEYAMLRAFEAIREGASEVEVAAVAEYAMRVRGASGPAFETIVASGPNAALPHAGTSTRRLRRGDVVIVDLGARYKGYCSDITRTVALGNVDERLREAHEAVVEAQREALKALKPGVKASDVDKAARDVLREYGLAEYFIHGTGHGLGIEVHERPRLSPSSDVMLAEGMVVTVEPGVYISGLGGVRVEDVAVVRRSGYELISSIGREMLNL